MPLVKMGESPGDYTFEVMRLGGSAVENLTLNIFAIGLALRSAGLVNDDEGMPNLDQEAQNKTAAVIREMAIPKELADAMTPAVLIAKYQEAEILFGQAGKDGEPSQT